MYSLWHTQKQKKRILKVLFESLPSILVTIMLLIIAFLIFAELEATLSFPTTVLTSSVNSIPINSGDVYPILLQGLIIAASMLFGFFAILLPYFVSDINGFLNKHISEDDRHSRIIFKAFVLVIAISPILLLLLSIFSALHATILYDITLTYTTEQISTNSIPANVLNIWNSTYFELIENYGRVGTTAYQYYQSLNVETQVSIRMLRDAGWIILLILLSYVLLIFGFFEYLADEYNKHHVIGSVILLCIVMLGSYLFKAYLVLYELVAEAVVILILLVYLYSKGAKGNKKDIVTTKTTEKTELDGIKA